ncbi:MAG TPA: hypothetical protein VM581_01820 [Magnetospirillaceae bacterium]|nr:hypothetical protein [Magnetospirillaceae bacterium]
MKQTKVDSKNTTFTHKLQSRKKLTWSIGIFLSLYMVSIFIPFVSAFTQYPLYVVKCMRLPIAAHAGRNYVLPDSDIYRITGFEEMYFCSEDEAHKAGYHKSPLND